jgi:hypothetical protein
MRAVAESVAPRMLSQALSPAVKRRATAARSGRATSPATVAWTATSDAVGSNGGSVRRAAGRVVAGEAEDPCVGDAKHLPHGQAGGGECVTDDAQCRVEVFGGSVADEDQVGDRLLPLHDRDQVGGELVQQVCGGGQVAAGGEHDAPVAGGDHDDAAVAGVEAEQVWHCGHQVG